MKRHAVVIGGSIAGLFAALHLQRIGWHVSVYERAGGNLDGRGAGIVTHPALFDALAAVGIDPDDKLGVHVTGRLTFAADGSISGRLELPQVLTSWGRLYQVLLARLGLADYHQGKSFVRCQIEADSVTAFFDEGSQVRADLLVGADGIRSAVREQFEPDCLPEYAGYVAWRGLVEEAALSGRTHEEMFGYFAFSLPQSEQMLGYPVAGDANTMVAGKRRYNIVWYRPADADTTLRELLTDTDGNMNGASIAPNKIRPAVLQAMRNDARRLLAPQFNEAVQCCEQPFLQPIYDLSIARMVYGRVVIIGDAAFVARPHVGMGVTKAADDAVYLADALANTPDITQALQQFGQVRHPLGQFIIRRARQLGAYMQAQIRTDRERAHAETFRTADAVMRQTATAGFLDSYSTDNPGSSV